MLPLDEGGVLSLVGAGGKTTFMLSLARELAAAGNTVLTTTTTKILMPAKEQSTSMVISADPVQVIAKAGNLLHRYRHITAAREHLASQGKLAGFEPDVINRLWETKMFRWILVEADGAAQRPLKAPASHEPVIPPCSTLIVAVVGLDVIGKSLDDRWVFRSQLYSQMTGVPPGSPVTERSVATMILHDKGLMKGCPSDARRYVLLNKAEDEHTFRAGRRIGSLLWQDGKGRLEKVLIGSMGKHPPHVERYDPETG
ncbi:MAG: putative selenium-dependent hydroxylase accessory protein YqeC [Candidatus Hydrogenedentota bacterium]|nr:MAG: putative selenium-dependent hydroxylase accessory protein YqeC [Candidatus Hydrogenedentota bacterium]